ncbi:MAG: bifunctional DNA primase/polymerase, partial [Nitrososphaera sp.]|uniref:bifunctional DNA primase/polymerase n=1 Tax=Nitrososphaera sp. TaxID=1971748 RepID=UPI003D6EDB29
MRTVVNMYRTFPLATNSKVPLAGSKGLKDAAYEPIDGNYGIATGEYKDGYFAVVDIDVKNGKNGFESLQAAGIELPATYTVATANGGQHHYYCTSTLLGSRNNLLEGVDLKGDGGYVVGPGSMIDGRSYTVIDDRPLAVLPEWSPAGLQDTRGQRCRSTMRQPRTVATREPTYTVPKISAELEVIDPNSGYDDWRDIIWCVRAIWGNTQNVLDACNDWSQQSHKYKAGDVEKVWESFDSEAFTADPHKRLGEL